MITSIHNPKVKKIVQLLNKPKIRKKEGLFVVEGKKMVSEIPANQISEVLISETYLTKEETYIQKMTESGIRYEVVSDSIIKHLTDAVTPQGIIGLSKMRSVSINNLITDNPLIIILENIQDPGNLGTIIRTADAAGASGVILSTGCVDLYNPKVVRSTMGSLFRVPILKDRDLASDITYMQSQGIRILATHLQGSQNIYSCNLTEGLGILVGNEGNGLTDTTTALADGRVLIPMIGDSESLNAGVATSIMVYEALRQRKFST